MRSRRRVMPSKKRSTAVPEQTTLLSDSTTSLLLELVTAICSNGSSSLCRAAQSLTLIHPPRLCSPPGCLFLWLLPVFHTPGGESRDGHSVFVASNDVCNWQEPAERRCPHHGSFRRDNGHATDIAGQPNLTRNRPRM